MGRHPTEVLIDEGSSLHEWVKSHFPYKMDPIVEHALDRCTPSAVPKHYNKLWRDVILEMIEFGLMCTEFTPSTRPSMLDVANKMGRLKDYLSNSSSLLIKEINLLTLMVFDLLEFCALKNQFYLIINFFSYIIIIYIFHFLNVECDFSFADKNMLMVKEPKAKRVDFS